MTRNAFQLKWIKSVFFAITVGVFSAGINSIAQADDSAYLIADGGAFGTTDLNTGATTIFGSSGLTFGGVGIVNNTLYGTAYDGTGVYSINTINGIPTLVGNGSVALDSSGSTTAGFFGFGTNDNLYSINPTNGALSLIGPTGLSIGSWRGLSTSSTTGVLYYAQDGSLYTVNTSTGAATLINNSIGADVADMIYENGHLYGSVEGGAIDPINTTTGDVTAGPNSGENIWDLAPDPLSSTSTAPVPEPMTLKLFGFGIVMAGIVAFRKKVLV